MCAIRERCMHMHMLSVCVVDNDVAVQNTGWNLNMPESGSSFRTIANYPPRVTSNTPPFTEHARSVNTGWHTLY